METAITRTGALTPDQRASVERLVTLVEEHDGVRPLNEQAHFALEGRGHAVHWLAYQGCQLIGYGQADRDDHSVQLMVSPQHRRQGVGSQLVEQMRAVERDATWWAFGNLPAARSLADRHHAGLVRELLVMERDLVAHPVPEQELVPPADVEIRGFRDSDTEALVEVNQEAFDDHPEQGEMSVEDFLVRCKEPWFDPEGLLVAADDETGALLGFHWTKTEHMDPTAPEELLGEVYVIGVRSEASGRGIGRALLAAGLEHLSHKGVRRVRLYVEATSERVVAMSRAASFVPVATDASYA